MPATPSLGAADVADPRTRGYYLYTLLGLTFVAGYSSVNAVVKAELFPTEVRTVGVAIPYNIAQAVFGGIATILLNRPHRKNAFTLEMLDHWAEALRSARTDPEVRVVLVTGVGGAFCAGVDLDDFAEITSTLGRQEVLRDRVHRVAAAALDLDKPLIAAVDRVAVGAGMDRRWPAISGWRPAGPDSPKPMCEWV
ncbi:enoyl-CoA hydratase-related protein [Nocardia rhamnosiphila]|uniref:enoyl-CoA hydratase/isomerase family protein n=1 Tax=Nocardia rhamnosiphila TaxID=426716 RepID=UPI0027E332DA|nr:enoyl-CoA hydratase-related protein [Nocardia zapadnayensis]